MTTPLTGFLTDEPRQATQRMETVTSVAVGAAAVPMAVAAKPAKQPMYSQPAGATRYYT
jgi:hypothetical protein